VIASTAITTNRTLASPPKHEIIATGYHTQMPIAIQRGGTTMTEPPDPDRRPCS
jgi:predicted alpha/beta superfamily hydrolase